MFKKRKNSIIKIVILTIFLTSCAQTQVSTFQASNSTKQSAAPISQSLLSKLPRPTNGFEWHSYKGVVFQSPNSWNENEKSIHTGNIPTSTYASSPEEFSESKMFEMGLTIQVIPEPNKTLSIPAKKMAQVFLKADVDSHSKEDILMFNQKNIGKNIETTVFRYQDSPPPLMPIIVHKYLIADEIEDTVYILTFESPVTTWEENWQRYGTPFLQKLTFVSRLQK